MYRAQIQITQANRSTDRSDVRSQSRHDDGLPAAGIDRQEDLADLAASGNCMSQAKGKRKASILESLTCSLAKVSRSFCNFPALFSN
jgi:hypothetical protein